MDGLHQRTLVPHAPLGGVRVVAFDLDCTLIDLIALKQRACEAAAHALLEVGLPIDPRRAARELLALAFEVGIDRRDIVDAWLQRRTGRRNPRLSAIGSLAYERAEDRSAVPYPGVVRTLEGLRARGYALALVSDAPREQVARRLRAARIEGFFDRVIAREDTPNGKADTAPFRRLSEVLGIPPSCILMVGDNPARDVGSARAFGCRTVLAAYGLQPCFDSRSPDHAADRTIHDLQELLGILPGPDAGASTPVSVESYGTSIPPMNPVMSSRVNVPVERSVWVATRSR